MTGLALVSAVLCMTLPETHNKPTAENLTHAQDPEDKLNKKDENKNEKNDADEESTLM